MGVHRIGASHINKMLLENSKLMREQGIFYADPATAKKAIVTAFAALAAQKPIDQISQEMLDAISPDWQPQTIVMGHESLSGNLLRPFSGKTLYNAAGPLAGRLSQILSEIPLRFLFGVRNLATYIPSVYAEGVNHANLVPLSELTSRTVLTDLHWAPMVKRVVDAAQDQPVHVWRQEDYPYIWRDVLGALTGLDNPQDFVGSSKPITQGTSIWGAEELVKQALIPDEKRDFKKLAEKIRKENPSSEFEGGHPEWTDEIYNGLTRDYVSDWINIVRMQGVTALQRQDFR
jgi:hypothetical protein